MVRVAVVAPDIWPGTLVTTTPSLNQTLVSPAGLETPTVKFAVWPTPSATDSRSKASVKNDCPPLVPKALIIDAPARTVALLAGAVYPGVVNCAMLPGPLVGMPLAIKSYTLVTSGVPPASRNSTTKYVFVGEPGCKPQ